MDAKCDGVYDKPSQVGSCQEMGRGQGDELQTPDREGCAGMVWLSFDGLNETFNTKGPDGAWVEHIPVKNGQSWFPATQFEKGHEVTQETRDKIAAKARERGGLSEEHRRKISEAMKGKKKTKEHAKNISKARQRTTLNKASTTS